MRIVFLFIFLAGKLFAHAQSPVAALQKISIYGSDYVPITQWARSNYFHLQWILTDKQLRATNAAARMVFDMNSRRAQINGINVALSLPVVWHSNIVFISTADLQNTLHPILYPVRSATNEIIKTICLDPGHGGRDPGKLDGRMQEKTFTLLLAEEVERILEQYGINVVQTRRSDRTLELLDRHTVTHENNADLFVSLHYNAAANKNAQGVEVYCLTPQGTSSSNGSVGDSSAPNYPAHDLNAKNILLAYQVQKTLVKNLRVEDRGVKRSQFVVLINPKCPAILIEAGFMTHAEESKRIYDSEYRKRMARAIADGILSYKKIVER